jgi:hypothetical protein
VRPEHGGIGTAMPRVVDDVDVATGDGDSSAGAYGRLLCHQRRMHEQVDPRWRRQHCGAGLACDHDPPHWARGCDAERHDRLEAGRRVLVGAFELGRLGKLAPPHAAWCGRPWEDRRWFQVSVDDCITERAEYRGQVDEPERNR